MSVVLTTITTATTGLQTAMLGVLSAAIGLAAVLFAVRWGWNAFRGTAKKSG